MTSFLSFSCANIKRNETGVACKCNSLSRQKYGSSSSIVPDLWAPKTHKIELLHPESSGWSHSCAALSPASVCDGTLVDRMSSGATALAKQKQRELRKHF